MPAQARQSLLQFALLHARNGHGSRRRSCRRRGGSYYARILQDPDLSDELGAVIKAQITSRPQGATMVVDPLDKLGRKVLEFQRNRTGTGNSQRARTHLAWLGLGSKGGPDNF